MQLCVGRTIVNDGKYHYLGFGTQLHKYFKLSIHFKITKLVINENLLCV